MRKTPGYPAYWWTEERNFGDLLTPLLLKRYAGLDATLSSVSKSRMVGVGSIIEHLPPDYDGTILGTGKLFERTRLKLERANILALRGPLTAVGIKGDYVLGDPGLLCDGLVRVEAKLFDTGVLPHWSDKTLTSRSEFHGPHTVMINPADDPLHVIRTIGECRRLVTSSLHGMIIADAFGIPRRMIYTPMMNSDGGKFKFFDYSTSIGMPLEIGKFQIANTHRVEDLRNGLHDAFEQFGHEVGR